MYISNSNIIRVRIYFFAFSEKQVLGWHFPFPRQIGNHVEIRTSHLILFYLHVYLNQTEFSDITFTSFLHFHFTLSHSRSKVKKTLRIWEEMRNKFCDLGLSGTYLQNNFIERPSQFIRALQKRTSFWNLRVIRRSGWQGVLAIYVRV